MKTKCYCVRLESLISISEKAFKATAYDGSTAIIPKSMVFGRDYSIIKSEAYWISSWILEKKDLQYSSKKIAWFDKNGKMLPSIYVECHKPSPKEIIENKPLKELQK